MSKKAFQAVESVQSPTGMSARPRPKGLFPLPRLLFVLVCALFLLAQASWLAQNETIVGNDAGSHLVRSVEVYEALQQPSRAALATIWQVSEHRPPFSYVLTVPFYWLLGLSYDAALWSNSFWLLLTGIVVYLLATRLASEWVGLWSATLTLTIPLLFALARLYYQEPLVTFLLWLTLLALLLSDDFARRGASVLFGAAVGLGLLVKWTLPTFLAGPLLLLCWRYRQAWRVIRPADSAPTLAAGSAGRERLKGHRMLTWRTIWWSLLIGALLAGGCVWLVAPMVESLGWLALFWVVWMALFALIGIGLTSEPSRTINSLLAGSIALLIATLWYFPRADFITIFSQFTFSDAGRPEEVGTYSLLDTATWTFYLEAIAWQQLGVMGCLLFLVALVGLRQRDTRSNDFFRFLANAQVRSTLSKNSVKQGDLAKSGPGLAEFGPEPAVVPLLPAEFGPELAEFGPELALFKKPSRLFAGSPCASFSRSGQKRLKSLLRQNGVKMLLVTLLGSWLIFTVAPFRDHARGFAPILPAIAILTVLGLQSLSGSGTPFRWGGVLLAFLLTWQVGQFALLTFPAAEPVARSLQALHLIADATYQYWPNSGVSDSAYHVAPAILDELLGERKEGTDERIFLSTLINETQLHPNTLRAEFSMMAPGMVRVIPLIKEVEAPYTEIFDKPFLLYKTGVANDVTPQAQEAINRITTDREGLFEAAFEKIWEQATPEGDTIILARRRHALIPNSVQEVYEPLMEQLKPLLTPNDMGVIDTKAQVNPLGALGWPETPILVPPEGETEAAIAHKWLANGLHPGQRLFAVLWNERSSTKKWLEAHLVRSQDWWFGDTHLIAYVVPTNQPLLEFSDLGTLGSERLERVTIEQNTLQAGGAIVLTLQWELPENEAIPYRTILELYAADGTLLAKRDLPSNTPWVSGINEQQTALLLPRELIPSPACLVIARYDPNTGERLLAAEGENHLSLCAWP